jgi:hypothetical protein
MSGFTRLTAALVVDVGTVTPMIPRRGVGLSQLGTLHRLFDAVRLLAPVTATITVRVIAD